MPLALIAAVTAVSFAAVFFRKAAPTHPLVTAGLRLAFASAFFALPVLRARRAGRLPASVLRAGVIGGLFYALHFGSWVTSLMLSSVAASVTLVTATPIFLALTAVAMGRDRPDRVLWSALALATTGILVIGAGDLSASREALIGDGLALLGAVAMAGYMLNARRLGAGLDAVAFSGVAVMSGAVTLLGTAFLLGIPLRAASSEALFWIFMAALIPQMIGHTLITWCLKHTTPTAVGLAIVGEPVGAALLAWLWLNEAVSGATAIGCGITLVGVGLAVVRGGRSTRRQGGEAKAVRPGGSAQP